jgi:elongation factor G
MKAYPPAKVRNVVLLGHGGSGKTTLSEALLHVSGAINRPGRVQDGSTVSDFDPEEHTHHLSTSTSLLAIEWHGHKINVLDAPGYADFTADAVNALSVADLAVFVVSAVDGVEVQTEVLWAEAARRGIPRLFFINKLDRERANFTQVLEQLQQTFGAGVAPLELPIGAEAEFCGVADLLSDTAITYQAGKASSGPIPDDMEVREHAVHDALVEGIVVADDELMTRYLDGDIPAFDELEKTLAQGVASAQVFPVICGSAVKEIAIDRLANYICEIGPSPLERPGARVRPASGSPEAETTEVPCDHTGQPLVRVFKTVADPYVGKISLMRVLSGTLKPDIVLVNTRTKGEERLHNLATLRGKEQVPVDEVDAGDLVAVAKLAGTGTGDTLAPKSQPVVVVTDGPGPFGDPVLSIAIRPKSKADEDKLMTALHKLQEEDLTLRVARSDETHQTLLSGTGDTHLAIALERLTRKFGVAVESEDLVIPYRETITATAEAEGKYKKQSGGHGQFGVASVRVEPAERGAGFEFIDQIVGGVIPRQFIPAVQKGAEEALAEGGVYGWPVMDIRVTCFDGKHHPVDSSEMSFKMAGALAVREALAKAHPVVLEPLSLLEVTVPDAYQGDVMGDLNSRRGRVQGTETGEDGTCIVVALVPTAELARYAVELRSLTGGRGRFTARHDHYDLMPQNLWDSVRRERTAASS